MRLPGGKDFFPDFSFIYGGIPSAELLPKWNYQSDASPELDSGMERYNWIDPDTGLRVTVQLRCLSAFRTRDSCSCDWVLLFENLGTADTQILEEIIPADASIAIQANERLRLHYSNGITWEKSDFLPHSIELPPESQKILTSIGGYSSYGVLPFMNLQNSSGGWIIAIGWSGQWSARFKRDNQALHLKAGMEHTHLRLRPGEQIRTPRILVMPWVGEDAEFGQNVFRRLLMDCYLQRIEGELVLPPIAQSLMSYYYLTGQAGESIELSTLPKSAAMGVDVQWIDACWYGGHRQWWEEVGTWEHNTARFPHGLRSVSDAAHQAGKKFLLWFEPERARPDSRLAKEHPEFFLKIPQDPNNLLLDLGNPEALKTITDLISNRIEEYGVDIYRQDYNFEAVLPYWQAADAPDRVGMTEIRNVEGLYAFWDALRSRHPGLWIDNCASGGRRIDLETISRSLPLWPSDFLESLSNGLDLMVGGQCINAGLARWIPFFGGGVFNFTPYSTRSQIIGGFNFSYHVDLANFPTDGEKAILTSNAILAKGKSLLDEDFPFEQARKAISEWRELRPFILGDFHLLLPLTDSDHDWVAWQFHRADLEAGIALFLRRHNSPFPSIEVALKRMDPQSVYAVSLSAGYIIEHESQMSGSELQNLVIQISERPGSLLLRYQKVV